MNEWMNENKMNEAKKALEETKFGYNNERGLFLSMINPFFDETPRFGKD